MKKSSMLMVAAIVTFPGFYACKTSPTKAEQAVINLNNYVDSVEALKPVYTSSTWSELNSGYEMRLQEVDNNSGSLTEAEKERLEASKAKYIVVKKDYEVKIMETEKPATPDYRTVLRSKLFGEGVVGSDMSFSNVTGANILSVYRNFVNTVADNRNSYSREDWDEIKVLYEALDTRKNTVEKDAPRGDNTKIAGLKIKFASIKGTNRGSKKGEENQDAIDKAN
jgi:hypothetical protein